MFPLSFYICNRYGEIELVEYETLEAAKDGLEALLDEDEARPNLSLHHAIVTLQDALEEASEAA
jgi:hypothetical protein